MKYKLTRVFLRSKELLLATFCELNDAKLFMDKKMYVDERNAQKVLYRLYDDLGLIYEKNNEITSNLEPDDPESMDYIQLPFKVVAIVAEHLERVVIAHFHEEQDAIFFATIKSSLDSDIDRISSFLVFKDQVMIATLNKTKVENQTIRDGVETAAKGSSFKPSPLKTRPTPPGGPPDCWEEDEKER